MRLLVACCLGLVGACAASGPEPVAEDAGARAQHVRASDGLELVYEEFTGEECGVGAPALVFVHGWAGERGLWRATLEAFAGERRVLALDLGGHGSSGRGRVEVSLARLALDVVEVVQAAGLEDCVLVGHSLGAPVALLAAPALAPRVRAVVAVEALHDVDFRYPPGALAAAAAELERDFPRALEGSLRLSLGPGADEALCEWLTRRALGTERATALALLNELESFELGPALAGAGVPVRALNADPRGGKRPPTNVEANRRHADFEVVLLERVGHFPMLEDPPAFRAALRAVLAEFSAPPSPQ